ncbi:hypothetical protein THASP1DRAFT_32353 [Thamnocephalis sphaerospora]|uniref:VPS9 domain-containing protein n=1 Tax=Thamnocephalis sphaerospora TaxID=78915 RepID=A0A4P9XJ95_9FUNG|nr:hypothetical protein THASP1DRAFT_32353 [Thamnocephalis sphaerospora]|eukprot:RKP05817.1 hypothetical protein THASP1DRAFT_32353 [Thamnocephalis sphaerospora]
MTTVPVESGDPLNATVAADSSAVSAAPESSSRSSLRAVDSLSMSSSRPASVAECTMTVAGSPPQPQIPHASTSLSRASTAPARSSWLPVSPFSFFSADANSIESILGAQSIGHAFWTRLLEQRKEDVDLLAFLHSRKAVILLPRTEQEAAKSQIDRSALVDHIFVRVDDTDEAPTAVVAQGGTTSKSERVSGTDSYYGPVSMQAPEQNAASGALTSTLDFRDRKLVYSIEQGDEEEKASAKFAGAKSREFSVEIVQEEWEMTQDKHSIIGIIVSDRLPAQDSVAKDTEQHGDAPTPDTDRVDHAALKTEGIEALKSPGFSKLADWEHIVKYLDSFVQEFGNTCRRVDPPKSPDACSEEYQTFLEHVHHTIDTTEHLKQDLNMALAMEWIEKYLTVELYPCLFAPWSGDDSICDQLLQSRCAALNILHVDLEHLGISVSDEGRHILGRLVDEAGAELQQMDRVQPPIEKLERLVRCHEIIVDALNSKQLEIHTVAQNSSTVAQDQKSKSAEPSPTPSRESKRTQPSSTSSNADSIFPLLIYIIIRTNIPHIVSNARYMQRYRHQSELRSKHAYCLTNLFAVISFLETVDMRTLGLAPASELSGSAALEHGHAVSSIASEPLPTFTLPTLQSSTPPASFVAALRGGRDATVAVADGVNKAITGAVDIVFGRLLNARSSSVPSVKAPSVSGTIPDDASAVSDASHALSSTDATSREQITGATSSLLTDTAIVSAAPTYRTSYPMHDTCNDTATKASYDQSMPTASPILLFAVISFLETVDMRTLGLAPASELSGSAALEHGHAVSSIASEPLPTFTLPTLQSSTPPASFVAALRGGRDATVAVADGVNKAITGAVDIVFGRLLNARSSSVPLCAICAGLAVFAIRLENRWIMFSFAAVLAAVLALILWHIFELHQTLRQHVSMETRIAVTAFGRRSSARALLLCNAS